MSTECRTQSPALRFYVLAEKETAGRRGRSKRSKRGCRSWVNRLGERRRLRLLPASASSQNDLKQPRNEKGWLPEYLQVLGIAIPVLGVTGAGREGNSQLSYPAASRGLLVIGNQRGRAGQSFDAEWSLTLHSFLVLHISHPDWLFLVAHNTCILAEDCVQVMNLR